MGSALLVFAFAVFSPIVISLWSGHFMVAFVLTFLGNACFISLEFISNELDQPFGDDANDLPCMKFQEDLNDSLMLLMNPSCQDVPGLSANAQRTHEALEHGKPKWM